MKKLHTNQDRRELKEEEEKIYTNLNNEERVEEI